jgi:hypothetical protein
MKSSKSLKQALLEDFIYNEMASSLFHTNSFFFTYSKKVKEASNKKINLWQVKGWNHTRNYLKARQKEYLASSKYTKFSEWFQFEIPLYSREWENLPEETQNVMIQFFKKLDENPEILEIEEK